MKVRVETVSPDGFYVYIDEPICVMTWEELMVFLQIYDKLKTTKDISNLKLRTINMTEENWEGLWAYILERGQADDDFCDIKCGWMKKLTRWRKEWEENQGLEDTLNR